MTPTSPTAPGYLLPAAVEAVDRASAMIRGSTPGRVVQKSDRDPASDTDFAVERAVRGFLADRTPEVAFRGEEDGGFGCGDQKLEWVLDPVDGTVNYLHGIPLSAISLGLVRDGTPVLGVIDLPFLGRRYSAVTGRGAHRGEYRLRASQATSLADAVVALGDYAVGVDAERKNSDRIATTARLAAAAQRLRMFGSAAIDLVWVAEGLVEATVMFSNKPWDTAAGVVIAREAGALVIDREGREHTPNSGSTVATCPGVADQILPLLTSNSPIPEY